MKEIYCCLEDIDMGIDDFLLAHETFPVMLTDETHLCAYCKEPSKYRLALESQVAETHEAMI